MVNSEIILEYAALTGIGIMTISLVFPMLRLFRGPSLFDRVVALDQVAGIIIGIIFCEMIYSQNIMLLDVVLAVSLLLVFSSMIVTRYLLKKQKDD